MINSKKMPLLAMIVRKQVLSRELDRAQQYRILTQLVDEALALTHRYGKQAEKSRSKEAAAYLFAEYEAGLQIVLGLVLQLHDPFSVK